MERERTEMRTDCHFQPTPQKQPGMIDLRPACRQDDSNDRYTDDKYRQGKNAGKCQLLSEFYRGIPKEIYRNQDYWCAVRWRVSIPNTPCL